METLKKLSTESYNYKSVKVIRTDTIEAGFSTLSCYPKRTWTINGKKAFTIKIEGEVYLAAFLEKEASEGGVKTILKDFKPECGFYIKETEELKKAIDELGMYVEREITETEF